MDEITKERAKQSYRSHKRALVTRNVFIYLLLIVVSLLWLIPFVYLLVQSFSSLYSPSYFFPRFHPGEGEPGWTAMNYKRLFTDTDFPFWKWYLNTLIISLAASIVETAMVIGTSYAFSRLRFRLRRPLMRLIYILGMFPSLLSMVIIYFILKLLHMEGSLVSLFLIYIAGSALQYCLAKGFFDEIPKSLDEAALMDGANKNTVFFKIILPLAKPIILYTALVTFLAPWTDFMSASLFAQGNTNLFTVSVGMQAMVSQNYRDSYFGVFCAGGVFIALPIAVLFFFLLKYIGKESKNREKLR